MSENDTWPGISVSKDVNKLIEDITNKFGPFYRMPIIDLMMTASAIAVKEELYIDGMNKRDHNIASPGNVASEGMRYAYLRVVMIVLAYLKHNKNTKAMDLKLDIVKNFEDHAIAGIKYLHDKYVIGGSSPEEYLRYSFKYITEAADYVKPIVNKSA